MNIINFLSKNIMFTKMLIIKKLIIKINHMNILQLIFINLIKMSYQVTLESSYKNQYNGVGLFHKVYGHPLETTPLTDIFDNNMKLVQFRISLINEEVGEFVEAIEKNDLIEAIDAVCDTLYVVNGAYHAIGASYPESSNFYTFTPVENEFYDTILELEKSSIQNSCNLLRSLVDGLHSCATNSDYDGFVHVLHSIQNECYNIANILRFNIDTCFNEVQSSNMSKVCSSEDEARFSVEWYKQNETRYSSPSYRLSQTDGYWVIYDSATSKILKSINFRLPNLRAILKQSGDITESQEVLTK